MKIKRIVQTALTGAAMIVAAAGTAPLAVAGPVTFAQYLQSNGAQQQWSISTVGNTTTVTASGAVKFLFSGVSGLPFSGLEDATFSLSASSSQIGNCGVVCAAGDSYVEPGFTGTFSFIDNGIAAGANLLSGTFSVLAASPATSGAQFSSHIGSSGGSFDASTTAANPLQLVLTSAYLNFAGQTDEAASWSLSSLIPNFGVGAVVAGQARPSGGPFAAAGSGTFSSNPGPTTFTPEPGTLMLIGGGLIGVGLLRRRKSLKTAALLN